MFSIFRTRSSQAQTQEDLSCSFCKKSIRDVRKLVAGPNVYICDECVEICVTILSHETDRPDQGANHEALDIDGGDPSLRTGRCALCGMLVGLEDLVLIENRGALCRACVSAVEAAAAKGDRTEENG